MWAGTAETVSLQTVASIRYGPDLPPRLGTVMRVVRLVLRRLCVSLQLVDALKPSRQCLGRSVVSLLAVICKHGATAEQRSCHRGDAICPHEARQCHFHRMTPPEKRSGILPYTLPRLGGDSRQSRASRIQVSISDAGGPPDETSILSTVDTCRTVCSPV